MRLPYLRTRRLTRTEHEALVERAVLDEDDPIELLDGRLYFPRRDPGHAAHGRVAPDQTRSGRRVRPRHHVRSQYPIALDDEPVPTPDVVVLRGLIDNALGAPPPPAVLVVEIADVTLTTDRGRKAGSYARAGVPDYWIVNLRDGVLEVYRNPARLRSGRWRYRTVRVLKRRARVALLAAPRARLRVADLLP